MLLATRALEKRRLGGQAAAGYETIYQREKASGETAHTSWQAWRNDCAIWFQEAKLQAELRNWEFADDLLTEAIRCSSLQDDTFWSLRATVAARLGQEQRSMKFTKNVAKGVFWGDL